MCMSRLVISLVFFAVSLQGMAQRDTVRIQNTNNIAASARQQPVLDSIQNRWLKNNYTRIGNMPKDQATKEITAAFPSATETQIEYFISSTSRMLKGDTGKDLAVLKQILETLKQEKKEIVKKINEKEDELNKTTDRARKKTISNEILELRKQLEIKNRSITDNENNVRRLQ